jgi:hypothetical protein
VAQGEDHGAEIGTRFVTWGNLTEEEQEAWYQRIAVEWKGNLLSGYATVHYHKPRRADNAEENKP